MYKYLHCDKYWDAASEITINHSRLMTCHFFGGWGYGGVLQLCYVKIVRMLTIFINVIYSQNDYAAVLNKTTMCSNQFFF